MATKHAELLCPNFRGIARTYDSQGNRELVAQLRCKLWTCEYCAQQNARQWQAAINHYLANSGHKFWSFHTITMPSWVRKKHKTHEARYEASCELVRDSWSRFRKRLKREYCAFQYVRVIEQHRDGTAHLHLLASFVMNDLRHVVRSNGSEYSYSRTVKRAATDCGFGYIIDNRNIADDTDEHVYHVAKYVTKYITKDAKIADKTRKKWAIRKIQTSRGIKRFNLETEFSWRLKPHLLLHEFEQLECQFFDVTRGKPITITDFHGGTLYPPVLTTDES